MTTGQQPRVHPGGLRTSLGVVLLHQEPTAQGWHRPYYIPCSMSGRCTSQPPWPPFHPARPCTSISSQSCSSPTALDARSYRAWGPRLQEGTGTRGIRRSRPTKRKVLINLDLLRCQKHVDPSLQQSMLCSCRSSLRRSNTIISTQEGDTCGMCSACLWHSGDWSSRRPNVTMTPIAMKHTCGVYCSSKSDTQLNVSSKSFTMQRVGVTART